MSYDEITRLGIDIGVRMPEAAHTIANRAAAKAMRDGRPMHASQRFNEAKYRAERGGYRRFKPGHSRRGEAAVPAPMCPKWLRQTSPNAKAPSSDMRALIEDFRAQHRT